MFLRYDLEMTGRHGWEMIYKGKARVARTRTGEGRAAPERDRPERDEPEGTLDPEAGYVTECCGKQLDYQNGEEAYCEQCRRIY